MPAAQRVFFDTNVLVYQFSHSAPAKRKRAQDLLEDHILDGRAVISSQVVQELMNVSLKKFATKMAAGELALLLTTVLSRLCAHVPTIDFYERALGLYATYSICFYDALILQAALDLGCETLYSEDLQDGQRFGSLVVRNPFA